jgi:hypothetical protein
MFMPETCKFLNHVIREQETKDRMKKNAFQFTRPIPKVEAKK